MEHGEENINWEEISKVMREGKKSSEAGSGADSSKIQHSKIYDSLYEELLDKCNPKNFMEPYDKKKVDAAILIYNDLSRIGKTNEKHIRAIRDRATLELGIKVSTDRLFKELIDYCNPQNFLTAVPFQADLLQIANHFYAQVRTSKNDIHELVRLSLQIYASKEISLFYEKRRIKETAADRMTFIFIMLIIIGIVIFGQIFSSLVE